MPSEMIYAICTDSPTPGWAETGLTMAQIERMVELERALAGDPGVPAERRKEVLLQCRRRVGWDALGHGDPALADLDRLYADAASMIRALADDLAEARRVCESLAERVRLDSQAATDRLLDLGRVLDHALADLPALLAALDERDDLIWRMSVDQEAFRVGQETERKAWADALNAESMRLILGTDEQCYASHVLDRLVKRRLEESLALRDPRPVGRERAEAARLREALRRAAEGAETMAAGLADTPNSSPLVMLARAGAEKIAREIREALGEGRS